MRHTNALRHIEILKIFTATKAFKRRHGKSTHLRHHITSKWNTKRTLPLQWSRFPFKLYFFEHYHSAIRKRTIVWTRGFKACARDFKACARVSKETTRVFKEMRLTFSCNRGPCDSMSALMSVKSSLKLLAHMKNITMDWSPIATHLIAEAATMPS